MYLGMILPSFAATPNEAFEAAEQAERLGLHGIFAFDHLWPMGEPGRPAIAPFPLLGAISARTSSIALGTLVARIGLVPDAVLVSEVLTLQELSGGRVVAGLGVGDSKSAAENVAYGVDFARATVRRASLEHVAGELVGAGVPTWVGGGSEETNAVARTKGAVLNLWGVAPEVVALAHEKGPVSWAGVLPKDPRRAGERLAQLAEAGATWAVILWPRPIEELIQAGEHGAIDQAR